MSIVILLFAILSITGAWAGWRRSPLYSAKITLKLVVIFLLIVATIVGLSWASTSGAISHSPEVQMAMVFIAIVAVGTGATALIVRTTDSHVAQLPASVRMVTIERHKVQRWIWRTLVYLLISGAAALAFPQWSWLPGVPALLVFLGCGPMLTALYMRARRLDRGMTQVVATPWLHWNYTPPQWQAWAASQRAWELAKNPPFQWKRDGWKWTKFLLFITLLFALGALVTGGTFRERVTLVAIATSFILVMMVLVAVVGHGAAERHYRRLLAAPPEAYFGAEGVFCNGAFTPWKLSGAYLIRANALHDPPARVELVFEQFSGSTSMEVTKRVPIPEGRESDLPLLQEKLSATSRTARVRLA
jgi:hypothetical protein